MKQDTLQSYFKSLCNSFYIAYAEVKRLEEELEKVDSTVEKKNLEKVKEVLTAMRDTESPIHKYISFKYTEAELELEKAELELIIHQKDKKTETIEEMRLWAKWMWDLRRQIYITLLQIKREKQTIIVTSKEEVYALMLIYREEGLINVLEIKEEYLTSFPKNDKVCSNFLEIYLSKNEERMKEFCKENI